MKRQILHCILMGILVSSILLLTGITAGAVESENKAGKTIISAMQLDEDGLFVQGPGEADDEYGQDGNTPTEIPLSTGLKAYFSFKGPSLKDFMEKVKVENDKLDYYRALFGFNIAF